MKNQGLFSSKDKSKKLNCRLLQFLSGALRVNNHIAFHIDDVLVSFFFFSFPFKNTSNKIDIIFRQFA